MIFLRTPTISIDDILDAEKYAKLNIEFYNYSIDGKDFSQLNFVEEITFQPENIIFSEKYYDDEGGVLTSDLQVIKEKKVTLNFFKDFIFPALDDWKKRELGRIEATMIEEKQYSVAAQEGYYNHTINRLEEYFNRIRECDFIDDELKLKLNEIINQIKHHLTQKIDQLNKLEKIPLDLGYTEIAILFSRLHRNGMIGAISVPDMANLISRYFLQKKGKPISPFISNKINEFSQAKLTDKQKERLQKLID